MLITTETASGTEFCSEKLGKGSQPELSPELLSEQKFASSFARKSSEKLELLEKLGKARSCLGVCGAYVVTAQLLRTCCDLLFVVLTVEGGVFCYDEHNYTSTTGPWRGSEGSQGSADAEGRRSSALAGNVRRGPLH